MSYLGLVQVPPDDDVDCHFRSVMSPGRFHLLLLALAQLVVDRVVLHRVLLLLAALLEGKPQEEEPHGRCHDGVEGLHPDASDDGDVCVGGGWGLVLAAMSTRSIPTDLWGGWGSWLKTLDRRLARCLGAVNDKPILQLFYRSAGTPPAFLGFYLI